MSVVRSEQRDHRQRFSTAVTVDLSLSTDTDRNYFVSTSRRYCVGINYAVFSERRFRYDPGRRGAPAELFNKLAGTPGLASLGNLDLFVRHLDGCLHYRR